MSILFHDLQLVHFIIDRCHLYDLLTSSIYPIEQSRLILTMLRDALEIIKVRSYGRHLFCLHLYCKPAEN